MDAELDDAIFQSQFSVDDDVDVDDDDYVSAIDGNVDVLMWPRNFSRFRPIVIFTFSIQFNCCCHATEPIKYSKYQVNISIYVWIGIVECKNWNAQSEC